MSITPPPSIRYLQLLKQHPQGLKLRDLVDAGGKSDRKAQAAAVTVLLSMRQKDRIGYRNGCDEGERGGTYTATPAGLAYLARKLDTHPEWAEELGEGVIETGAMRGECRTVIQRAAMPADVPKGLVATWVFGLAESIGSTRRVISA